MHKERQLEKCPMCRLPFNEADVECLPEWEVAGDELHSDGGTGSGESQEEEDEDDIFLEMFKNEKLKELKCAQQQ